MVYDLEIIIIKLLKRYAYEINGTFFGRYQCGQQ